MTVEVLCDLRGLFGLARDQDQRPTCLAFAASDAHAALRSPWSPLSVEFAFYHAQRRSARPPNVGATLPAMLETLREDGQPLEEDCPYLLSVPPDWKPSADIGTIYRGDSMQGGDTTAEIIQRLDGGQPVLVLLTLSLAFDLVGKSGIVTQLPGENLNPNRRHAVIAVGHGLLGQNKVVLIRNSWGTEWGLNGHAWITEGYLEPRVFNLAMMTEGMDDVPRNTAAA